MQARQDVVELFSTFVQFEANRFQGWAADGHLRRSMERCMAQGWAQIQPGADAELVWCAYWYTRWQMQAVAPAEGHLAAYLQEACYWAAQQISRKFASSQYSLPDYFQMAIADLPPVLESFNPDRGSTLKTYAAIAFTSRLRDTLRQRQEVDLCTPWTLLRKVSKKRLLESLHAAGLTDAAVAQYRLAWFCFKAVYVPDAAQRLPKPDGAVWEAIAQIYNRERLTQIPTATADGTPAQIEQWLTQCTAWVRAYLYPPVQSLNVPRPGQGVGDRQDALPDEATESLLHDLMRQEEVAQRQAQHSQLRAVLMGAIAQLDDPSQALLRLHYQDGLTQQQLAKQLAMSQATVSRRLTRAREALLIALVQWSQKELNNPATPTLIQDMGAGLEEWLRGHYDKSAMRLEP
ncbi:MAG: sigma-70 family RNA polymerase sigma factor [Synechococcales bacterium]|nr:sigma-70 family RNA polymerase sigma factor [Synechococcales bacterium]